MRLTRFFRNIGQTDLYRQIITTKNTKDTKTKMNGNFCCSRIRKNSEIAQFRDIGSEFLRIRLQIDVAAIRRFPLSFATRLVLWLPSGNLFSHLKQMFVVPL